MRTLCLVIAALCAAACANTSAVTRSTEHHNLTLDQASRIVADLAKMPPATAPKSIDDAVELLKSDEIGGFEAGVDFAAKDTTPQGKALQAQIALAWGEAQYIVSDLIDRATFNLHEEHQFLTKRQSTKGLDEKEKARLAHLRTSLDQMDGVSAALTKLGDEHIAEGIRVAKEVIAAAPNDYLGYRVAADFYRLTEDWAKFDEVVKKLEELNPKSNGLVFARAMEALNRNQDRGKAVELLNAALKNDPKFTRARTQLLLAHANVDAAWNEYQTLKTEHPKHQIVAWVGPTLEAEREALIAAAERATDRQLGLQLLRPR